MPAVDETMMMREGSVRVPAFSRSGANLQCISRHRSRRIEPSLQSCQVEDATDVQIQHLLAAPVWCRVERASPCRAGIADQNVQLVVCLLDLPHQPRDVVCVRNVRRNSDGLPGDRQLVELLDGLIDALWAFVLAC